MDFRGVVRVYFSGSGGVFQHFLKTVLRLFFSSLSVHDPT